MNKFSIPNFDIKKNIGYFAIALAMAVIFFIDLGLIMRPQLKTLSSVGRKAGELSAAIKKTRYNIKNILALEAEALHLQEKFANVATDLMSHQETVMVIECVSKLAAKYDVLINQISPLKEQDIELSGKNKGEFWAVPILINAEGGYHNIGLFFNAMESDKAFLDIQSFEIKENPRSPKKHLLTMTVMSFIPREILQ